MIKFLIKGLMRDRSRSLFPVLMVAAGAFLTVFLHAWIIGAMGDMLDIQAKFDTGHLKIVTRAYMEQEAQMPNDLAIFDTEELISKIEKTGENIKWTPRIRFGGLLDIPDENGATRVQAPVSGMGINIIGKNSPEIELLNLKNALIHGALPQGENEILISDNLAGKLKVIPGDTATLLGSTMNGAMAVYNFTIAGTVLFGITAMDRGTIIADIRGVRKALDMDGATGEIAGFFQPHIYEDKTAEDTAKKFNREYSSEKDEFSPFMRTLGQQHGMKEYLELAIFAGKIIAVIFAGAMSIVLWNSGLMNGIRRYGEIGIRLAMGEHKGRIYRWMIAESIVIGIIGSILGTLMGLAISYYIQYHGIDFGSMMQKSEMLISNVIRTRVTPETYFIGFIPGVIASVIGTMFAGIGIYRRETAQLFKELEV